MTNLEIIEKYRSFLISLKSNIENDVKFSITRLINDNQMSDSTVFEFIGTELTSNFCTDLRKFEGYCIKFHLSYTSIIFNK